jgi:methyl-accepting chemotaxis protein
MNQTMDRVATEVQTDRAYLSSMRDQSERVAGSTEKAGAQSEQIAHHAETTANAATRAADASERANEQLAEAVRQETRLADSMEKAVRTLSQTMPELKGTGQSASSIAKSLDEIKGVAVDLKGMADGVKDTVQSYINQNRNQLPVPAPVENKEIKAAESEHVSDPSVNPPT